MQLDSAQLNAVYSRLLEALYNKATTNGSPDELGLEGAPSWADGADHTPGAVDLEPYQCTLVATEWHRQAEAQKCKATPQSALAYEALAVVRMLGQQDFSGARVSVQVLAGDRPVPVRLRPICFPAAAPAAWKALRAMSSPDIWGRPPSFRTVLLLLRGLMAQVQAGLPPDVLSGAVEAAQRLAVDIAAEAEAAAESGGSPATAAKWPPLDSDMAATVLQLLLACHSAAEGEQQTADSRGARGPLILDAADTAAAVQQAGKGTLRSLCAQQEALPFSLCYFLLEAFHVCPALEDWTAATFGGEAVDEITCVEPDTPPVLLELQPAGGGSALGGMQVSMSFQRECGYLNCCMPVRQS